jgi:hypothetical protein
LVEHCVIVVSEAEIVTTSNHRPPVARYGIDLGAHVLKSGSAYPWDWLRLTCLNIEKVKCIGSWLREGHIIPLSLNGMGLVMEPQLEDDMEAIDNVKTLP